MWKTRPSACLSVTQYQRLITLSYFMEFLIWDLFKTLSRKRSFVKIDIVKARVDLDLWISNRTFHISLRIWTKEDVEDTQHRSEFISVMKMCVIQNHTLTKWATDIFARIFSLGAISKKKKKKKKVLVHVTSTKIHWLAVSAEIRSVNATLYFRAYSRSIRAWC
jgi:hypothetical protein